MIGRADIEGSKSNVAMNAWLPQASYHLRGHHLKILPRYMTLQIIPARQGSFSVIVLSTFSKTGLRNSNSYVTGYVTSYVTNYVTTQLRNQIRILLRIHLRIQLRNYLRN